MSREPCPCCSGKAFHKCCQPYLQAETRARTVQQLMRSRYSAYALGGHGDYLLHTWHPNTAPDQDAAALSQRSLHWTGLEVHESSQQGNTGIVVFTASYLDAGGFERRHHERSRFVREGGRWLYVNAEPLP